MDRFSLFSGHAQSLVVHSGLVTNVSEARVGAFRHNLVTEDEGQGRQDGNREEDDAEIC